MKKLGESFIIILVITVFISGAIVFVLMGSRSTHTHYVCLEVNPRVEFLTDSKHTVKSIKPINAEAKLLLIGEEFVGLKMDEACEKFLTLCAKLGYIDVKGDNAVKLTVLSGLNQALEVNLSKTINKFFVNNNILGILIDNSQDLQQYKDAKSEGVDIEKYDLMMAINENDGNYSLSQLRNKSNKELIKIIKKSHENYQHGYTEDQFNCKLSLLDLNKEKYENHINSINSESTKEFKMDLKKFKEEKTKSYKLDYNKRYNEWI